MLLGISSKFVWYAGQTYQTTSLLDYIAALLWIQYRVSQKKGGLVGNCHWGLWVELEKKVGPFLKNSGNFQNLEHKNCNVLSKKAWEIKSQRCLSSLKIMTILDTL